MNTGSAIMKAKKVLLITISIVTLAALAFAVTRRTSTLSKPANYQALLDEFSSVDIALGNLAPDHAGKRVAFVRSTETGRSLAVLDLQSLIPRQIKLTNAVTQINGWSSDDRFLAFVQSPEGRSDSWVTLWDSQTDILHRVTANQGFIEHSLGWLNPSNFFFFAQSVAQSGSRMFLGSTSGKMPYQASDRAMVEAVRMTTGKIGYLNRNIFELDLASKLTSEPAADMPVPRQLSSFPPGEFTDAKWVRYDPRSKDFLFCAFSSDDKGRHLYRFNSITTNLICLSEESTYNGQFLRELDGYACVVNTNDGFHLAVRTSEAVYATNLFEEGAVVNYTVAPARDIIYATATQAGEPAGIWEYDIKRKVQRRIFNGTAGKSVQPQTIRPSRFQVKSYDGMQISCFLLKTALSQGNGSHRSPLVIYLPPTSAQVQRGFMPFQQLLAKLGFACLSVNYRGCDGYGKAFARLKDPANAARDVLVALDTVLKRGDIDKANIFLYSASAGSEVAMELLKDAHHSWNGALLEYPTAIPQETFSVKSIPSILIVTGEKDPVFKSLGSLSTWARNRDMPVKLIVHTNLGHFNYKLNERRMDMDQGASLFFRNLK